MKRFFPIITRQEPVDALGINLSLPKNTNGMFHSCDRLFAVSFGAITLFWLAVGFDGMFDAVDNVLDMVLFVVEVSAAYFLAPSSRNLETSLVIR